MSNKNQSSIEWLVEKIQQANPSFKFDALIRQAKEMHKEEIIKFAEDWGKSNLDCKEDLYNETFGNNTP
jgi:hypothetical protein